MKIEHYSFTRGGEMDYGVFSSPSNLTGFQLDLVRSKLMCLLGDDVEQNLNIPKWILYKEHNFLVWGVCCENSILASGNNLATHKNRPIRGFFSVVITNFIGESLKLPFDINYFRELYRMEIEPYWNQIEQHPNKICDFIDGKFNFIHGLNNSYIELLNTNHYICQSLGDVDREGVVSAAMTLDEVSLLIDSDNLQQAVSKNGSFMNCLTSSVPAGAHEVMIDSQKFIKHKYKESAGGRSQESNEAKDIEGWRLKNATNNMEKHIKTELENANRRIAELELEVENKSTLLKKKDRLVKILSIALGVLLIALLYSQYLFSLKLFEDKQGIVYSSDMDYGNIASIQPEQAYFNFCENTIEIDANAHESFLVKFKTDLNNEEITIEPDVDWIRVLSMQDNVVTIEIYANNQAVSRSGKITSSSNNVNRDSVTIIQGGL